MVTKLFLFLYPLLPDNKYICWCIRDGHCSRKGVCTAHGTYYWNHYSVSFIPRCVCVCAQSQRGHKDCPVIFCILLKLTIFLPEITFDKYLINNKNYLKINQEKCVLYNFFILKNKITLSIFLDYWLKNLETPSLFKISLK